MGLESIHLSLDTPPAYDGGIFGEIGRLTVQGGMLDDDELPHPPPDDPGFQSPLIEETLDLNGYVYTNNHLHSGRQTDPSFPIGKSNFLS